MSCGRAFIRCQAILFAASSTLIACATPQSAASRLDSRGITVVTLADAIVLSRPDRRLAANASDYAYVGPVRVNRMGHYENLLWIGLASTIDRPFQDAPADIAAKLALIVDGQPIVLPLVEWETDLDRVPYRAEAPLYATFAAPTSLDQIQRIATASSVEAHFVSGAGELASYRTWQGAWSSWLLFVSAD